MKGGEEEEKTGGEEVLAWELGFYFVGSKASTGKSAPARRGQILHGTIHRGSANRFKNAGCCFHICHTPWQP